MDYTLFIDTKGYLCARVRGEMAIRQNFPGVTHLPKNTVIMTYNGIDINSDDDVYYRLIDMIPHSIISFRNIIEESCHKHSIVSHELDMLETYFGEDVFDCEDVFDSTDYTVRTCASLRITSN